MLRTAIATAAMLVSWASAAQDAQVIPGAGATYLLVFGSNIEKPTFTMEPGARICGPLKFYDKDKIVFELQAGACFPEKP